MRLALIILFLSPAVFAQHESKLNNRAAALMDEDKYDQALPILQTLVKEFPSVTVYRYNRAVCLFNLDQYEASLKDYRYLAESMPDEAEYFFQIANLMELMEKKDSVRYYYSRAIALDTANYQYYFKRGTFSLLENKWQDALADLSESIRLNPNHANAYHNRAIAHYKLKQPDSACADWCTASKMGLEVSETYLKKNCSPDKSCP